MNVKLLLRTIVFLAILFAVLYVGMNNLQPIKFSFPIASDRSIEKPAALIYFAIFAAGVLGGVVLGSGGKGAKGGGREK